MPSLTLYCTITAENGKRVPITVSDSATPTDLRLQVSSATKIPLGTLRLIFRGRMIKDDSSLNVFQEYKVEQDCVLHCMGKPNKDASSSSETPAPLPAAAAPTITAAALPSSNAAPPTDPLQQALEMLRTNASSPAVYQTAVTTLDKILTNIMQNPREEKFRKVKVHNAAFQKRLGGLVGGRQAVLATGFIDTSDESGTQIYLLTPSPEAWSQLQKVKTQVEQAVEQAKRTTMAPPSPSNINGFGEMGGNMGGFSGMGGMPQNPAAAAAAADLMRNPQALQGMLQNPMFQQMIQNNPSIPPNMRQTMQSLAQNPQMMNQVTQMMNDPMMRTQMEALMRTNGAEGFRGMGNNNMGAMPNMNMPNNTVNPTNRNNSEVNDHDQTEDDMIAEAIRRSLEES